MTYLTRIPRRRSSLWDDSFDNFFNGLMRPVSWMEEAGSEALVPAMDITEGEHEYRVTTEMPGVKKEDIDINLENGVLTISAETKSETEEKEGDRVIRQERRYGKYTRSLRLGQQVDPAEVKADYKEGILELTLPKAEEVKPKKISVNVD